MNRNIWRVLIEYMMNRYIWGDFNRVYELYREIIIKE